MQKRDGAGSGRDPEARGGGTSANLARATATIYTCGEPASFPWRDSVLRVSSVKHEPVVSRPASPTPKCAPPPHGRLDGHGHESS